MSAGRADILEKILAVKRDEVAALRARRAHDGANTANADGAANTANAANAASSPGAPRSLRAALHRPSGAPMRVLAEVKRASPSAGAIRAGANAVDIARQYADAGAAAISVLTDRQFFDGDIAFIRPCHDAVSVPILRKDFLIDALQIEEAARHGADAILLIVSALSRDELDALLHMTRLHGLEALVEVHDLAELETALSVSVPPSVIGVNHRDLRTFTIDMTLTEQVAKRVPSDVVLVAESGIRTPDDIRRMTDAGAHAVLVGEHLMRAASPGAALRELLA